MPDLATDDSVLLDMLRHDEAPGGRPVLHAYPDPLTKGPPWTIGFGSTGEGIGPSTVWTPEQCELSLKANVVRAMVLCDTHCHWWRAMSLPRQRVVASMMFNMGWLNPAQTHGLGTFHHTLAMMQSGDYASAALGMRNSAWAHQVGARAQRLADMMVNG